MLIALTKDQRENARGRAKRSDDNSFGGRTLKKTRIEEVLS